MAQTAPDLPMRFPCWCRAIYSWGGESKRDLGFIEGDLIECLNAGDGSWWMGRLHRDRRAMGLFPSNFVRILDDSFIPSRTASPMPDSNRGRKPSPSPQKVKSSYRKPFQAYARAGSPNPTAEVQRLGSRSRGPSPSPGRHASRTSQSPHYSPSRNPSPYASRVSSPAPPAHQQSLSRNPSHVSRHEVESSPPPAPPPHRTAYNAPAHGGPSPTPSMNDRYPAISRGHTPVPPSPGAHGLTPSPLRDAMEDVMSSLHDMGLQRDAHSPSPDRSRSPLNPWSPEAFEEFRQKPHSQKRGRPNTSAGISESYGHHSQFNGTGNGYNQSPSDSDDEEPPYLSNYVQRMESRLRSMHAAGSQAADELFLPGNDMGPPPAPPPKNSSYQPRAFLSLSRRESVCDKTEGDRRLRNRKSAYELGRQMVGRTFTTKSSATNSSSGAQSTSTNSTTSTDMTSQSGFSATSAGSLARRKGFGSIGRRRPMSVAGSRQDGVLGLMNGGSTSRPQTPLTSVSYHSSHDSKAGSTARGDWRSTVTDSGGVLGGLTTPKPKKSGFFKKLVDSARTGAASARSSIASGQSEPPRSPVKNLLPSGLNGISGGSVAKDMGMQRDSTAIDWVQVRRDINRSNSLSRNERTERLERCQMLDQPALAPVDALFEIAEGDESLDGLPISEPANFQSANLQLVDKSARFVNSLPPMTNPMSLAQGYVCRPYKSDVQRLRAVFTWVSEKVAWEEDFEGEVDTRRIIQTKRGCAEEVAVLVTEMCLAMGLHAEVVRGYLKVPGEIVEVDNVPQPNHWWNAVLVDGEWRIMDCSLASPTNPKRGQYSSAGSQVAESWWFLARPMEICYTHIPSLPEQQHICPPIPFDVLLALPCACPPYFKNELRMKDYDTSLLFLENLELVNIQFTVPSDVECFAEVEARAFVRDVDGDLFESGDTVTKRALAQAEWVGGQKRFTVKALLPGDEGHGVLKVYAGKRGLMHSIKDNPHPLAFALPIVHTGQNPPYDFLLRHPTPHAQRHDLYVAQPQCARLAINNTFVFAVRQHPSSLTSCSSLSAAAISGAASPLPFSPRPASAMSMTSSSAASSTNNYFSQNHTTTSSQQQQKPAKLAIQAPSGKILRLSRKGDHVVSTGSSGGGGETADGGVWETIIKIGERGTWRGLVLADRSARWCVFGEWECG